MNKIQNEIILLIKEKPNITQKEMAKILDVNREKIKYNIALLKEMKIIDREGSNKLGEWRILEK